MMQRTPWTTRVLEVLADGEWHTLEELVEAAGPLIPPGRATRQAHYSRDWQRARRRADGRPEASAAAREARTDGAEMTGRRQLIVASVNSLVRYGRVERGATGRYRAGAR